MNTYRIIARTASGSRAAGSRASLIKKIEAVLSEDDTCPINFFPYRITLSELCFVVFASESTKDDVLRVAKKMLTEISGKLIDRRIKDISLKDASAYLDNPSKIGLSLDFITSICEKTGRYFSHETQEVVQQAAYIQTELDCVKDLVFEPLDELVGLTELKETVRRIVAYARVSRQYPKKNGSRHIHMVFSGNPGVAKTTVARSLGEIFYKVGVISKPSIVEVGRADLIARYVGQTAPQTAEAFKSAKGTILFIDEAYQLLDNITGSYGDESINTLVQLMDNHPDTIVIFAGYPERMKEFVDRNEGLRSRVQFVVNFPDYTAGELYEILEIIARKNGYRLADDVQKKVTPFFEEALKNPNNGNGRLARNMFEEAEQSWAIRVDSFPGEITEEVLTTLYAADFSLPNNVLKKTVVKRIGFDISGNADLKEDVGLCDKEATESDQR